MMIRLRLKIPASASFYPIGTWLFSAMISGMTVTDDILLVWTCV